ncbi:hypothetical protein SMC26_17810 [Actinomadura fulvescens]|uniref:Uncharacterized protein n=1 Tax=Actinomadura fulvescens TaxID=46160 RepID=A0ABN3Q066_9ACTN
MTSPTNPNRAAVPGDLFARHQIINGLRALAALLEANPDIPVTEYGWTVNADVGGISRDAQTDQAQRAHVDQIAELLGVPVRDDTRHGGHYEATRSFGRITYQAVHIPSQRWERHFAERSYDTNITLDDQADQDRDRADGRAA